MKAFCCLSAFALLSSAAYADGLIVQRGAGGLEFSPAAAIAVNGKDRALNMGEKADAAGAGAKLPSVKFGSTLITDQNTGVVAAYSAGARPQYLYPNGLSKKVPVPAPQAWKESSISYKKSQHDKAAVEVPGEQFVAYLANGVSELADLCMDPAALALIGGAKGAFAAQLELTAAAVAAFGTQPAMAPLERKVAAFLAARQTDFDNGNETVKALEQGLRFSELSAKAYANQPEHQKYRQQLAESKTWLDRRVAVLKTLAAGGEWDAFLIAFRDFEKHKASFPDLAGLQQKALKASLEEHWKSGKDRTGRGEYRRAYGELRLASLRQPSNAPLKKDVAIAWVEYSRQVAVDRRSKGGGKQLSTGERDAITQSLHFAQRYKQQGKLDDALKHVIEAERGDAQSLPVLLAKAEILGARQEYGKALAALDTFDQQAVDEERAPGNKLRNDLMFQLTDNLNDLHKKLSEAWGAGRFHQTLRLAGQGLLIDENDPEILYHAAVAALATRDRTNGLRLLGRYLAASDNLDADAGRRLAAARLMRAGRQERAAEEGTPDWFSGRKLPAGTFYSPLSVTFVPKVERIEGSNKMKVAYAWDGERLKSIQTTFEKAVPGAAERSFYFAYNAVPQVMGVDVDAPRKAPTDPDELIRASNVVLPNHPAIDAAMVEQLTGKRVTVTVVGNRFFHPFVWERPYVFAMRYDEQGRARRAEQVGAGEGAAPVAVDFEWNGTQLVSVKAYQGSSMIYERTQHYQMDKLTGEEIRAGGKTSKIKYVWNGGTLVSADCDKDESLDSRSRDVFFVTAGGVKGRK